MKNVLVIYSNPAALGRIRLDKEHRVLDQLIASLNLNADSITRKHASTLEDFTSALGERDYDIIQFSGHGSQNGLIFESSRGEAVQLVSAEQILKVVTQLQPRLTAAMFMACFSATAIVKLIDCSPYLITVFGPAEDDASIEFIRIFYENYFRHESVERAFFMANFHTGERLSTALTRKAVEHASGDVIWQVFPIGDKLGDSIFVNLTEAEDDIGRLDISRESFLALLTRKIRLHKWIFDCPRERVVLPLGRYFGIFSWKNAVDVVRCHRIMKPKKELDQTACDVWAGLIVSYNDDSLSPYRLSSKPIGPENKSLLARALKNFKQTYHFLYKDESSAEVFTRYVPDQYKLTGSIMKANLEKAETKLAEDDLNAAVLLLETALSAEHDLVNAATESMSD